jgi:hypothetical protein
MHTKRSKKTTKNTEGRFCIDQCFGWFSIALVVVNPTTIRSRRPPTINDKGKYKKRGTGIILVYHVWMKMLTLCDKFSVSCDGLVVCTQKEVKKQQKIQKDGFALINVLDENVKHKKQYRNASQSPVKIWHEIPHISMHRTCLRRCGANLRTK